MHLTVRMERDPSRAPNEVRRLVFVSEAEHGLGQVAFRQCAQTNRGSRQPRVQLDYLIRAAIGGLTQDQINPHIAAQSKDIFGGLPCQPICPVGLAPS
jgi:hypothetical protein